MYITAKEAAEKWNISLRTVQYLCREGHIEGVTRWGRSWMIPEDAERSTAKNLKIENNSDGILSLKYKNPFVIVMQDYWVCQEEKMEPEQKLIEAWFAYARGDIKRIPPIITELLTLKADFYGTISLGLLQAACAIWLGDTRMWLEGRKQIMKAQCSTPEQQMEKDFWLATTDEGLQDNTSLPDWFKKGQFDALPEDSHPSAWHYYAKYLYLTSKDIAVGKSAFPEVEGLGALRVLLRLLEPMISWAKADELYFLESFLRCLCAAVYHDLGEKENAIFHMDKALSFMLPHELYGILAEVRGVFSNFMDERISLLDSGAVKKVKKLQKEIMEGFSKMNKTLKDIEIVTTLSQREQEVAKLAALGLSNMEIADRLQISISSVKTMISMIMTKTGTKKRSEFAACIL